MEHSYWLAVKVKHNTLFFFYRKDIILLQNEVGFEVESEVGENQQRVV